MRGFFKFALLTILFTSPSRVDAGQNDVHEMCYAYVLPVAYGVGFVAVTCCTWLAMRFATRGDDISRLTSVEELSSVNARGLAALLTVAQGDPGKERTVRKILDTEGVNSFLDAARPRDRAVLATILLKGSSGR